MNNCPILSSAWGEEGSLMGAATIRLDSFRFIHQFFVVIHGKQIGIRFTLKLVNFRCFFDWVRHIVSTQCCCCPRELRELSGCAPYSARYRAPYPLPPAPPSISGGMREDASINCIDVSSISISGPGLDCVASSRQCPEIWLQCHAHACASAPNPRRYFQASVCSSLM